MDLKNDNISNQANGVYTFSLVTGGVCEIVDRYERLKDSNVAGIELKKEDADFMKAFSEFLSMKRKRESFESFNQRKSDFLKKNYQNFVTYEKFAKQLDMSLMDYISMNADIAINRPIWARAAKALNKKLGGQLSDEVVEVLSKRISSYSPTIKGVEGSQRVSLDTKELLFNFIKRANTPPDGQYFACMLEDFANMPNGKTLTFMPDNGWLVKNKAEGVQRSYSSSIQLKNNDVNEYGILMHEIHHDVNGAVVLRVQKNGHEHLGHFFNEALSKSDNWLVDAHYQKNKILKDIRSHYEAEAKKLYPDDIRAQARYAFTKARGRYISIMLAGNGDDMVKVIDDFYLKTGAKKTSTGVDFAHIDDIVSDWYNYYQRHYQYEFSDGADVTQKRINEYLKKHFDADTKVGDGFVFTLDKKHLFLVSDYNFYLTKDNTCRYVGSRDKNDIARLKREWKKHGVILNDDLSVPPEQKAIIDRVSRDTRLFFYEDFKFCFERKLVDGEVVYEAPKEYKNYSNRVQDLKSYYQKNGIEVDINPENGRLRIHPNSVKKYEAHLSSTLDSLKLDQFKLNDQGVLEADFDEEFCKKMSAKYRSVGLYVDYRHKSGKAELVHAEHIDCIDELTGGYFKLREKIPHYKNNGLISSARLSKEASNVGISINVEDVTDNLVIPKIREAHAIELEKQLLEMGYSSDNIKIKDINDGYGYKKVIVFGEEKKLVDDIFPLFRNQAGKIVINKDKCVCLQKSESMIKYTPRYTIVGEGVDTMDSDTLKGLRNRAIRAGIDPQDIQLVLDADGINSRSCLIFLNEDKTDDFLRKELSSDGRQLLHKLDPQDLETPDELKQYLSQKDAPDFDANDGVELSVKGEENFSTKGEVEKQNTLKRVKGGIQKGRAALNSMADEMVMGAVGVGLKAAAPLLNTSAVQKMVKGVAKVHSKVETVKAGAVERVGKLPGGKQALKALRVAGNVAKVGGPAVSVAMSAVDPNGTKEMISDVTHGRWLKIVHEGWDGIVQLTTNTGEVFDTVCNQVKTATARRYEGSETKWDYTVKTGEALGDGVLNIAEVLKHLGGEASDLANSNIRDLQFLAINSVLNAIGSEEEFAFRQYQYKEYEKDPLKFIAHIYNPVMVNKKTGLRDDDTFFSVIESGNVARLKDFIEKGGEIPQTLSGQPIAKDLDGHTVEKNGHNPYTTAIGVALGAGQMDMAAFLYHKREMDINGINEATRDTTLMSLLYQMAPDESVKEYYTGEFLNIAENGSYSPKAKKDFVTAMAMVDAMLGDENLDIKATNRQGKDAFLVAVETGHYGAVNKLIDKGVDINRITKDGSNALHLCTHNELMTYQLIAKGVDVNRINNRGETPLMVALEKHQNINTIAPLLVKTNKEGLVALLKSEKHISHFVSYVQKEPNILCQLTSNPLIMSAMIEMGFDANQINEQKKTPLMIALEDKNTPDMSIAVLLDDMDEKGVEVLLQSKEHQDLLQAYFEQKPEILMALLTIKDHPLYQTLVSQNPDMAKEVQRALDEMAVGDENQEVPLNAPDGVVVSLKEKEGTMQTQEQPHLDERLANNSSIVKEGPQNGIIEQQKTAERV